MSYDTEEITTHINFTVLTTPSTTEHLYSGTALEAEKSGACEANSTSAIRSPHHALVLTSQHQSRAIVVARAPAGLLEKRKADEASLDGGEALPTKKRRRGNKVVETLSKEERDTVQGVMDSVHNAQPSNTSDIPSRGMIDSSLDLSHKASIPDCHQLIRQPIAMKQIESKFNKKQYHSPRVVRHDIALLYNNCRQYNEEGSVPYNDDNMIKASSESHA
ncbi:transcriptional regulator [Elasticomyces elasticus]|nr:transcriptional regulator [Elasticomyces elasticus]